MINTRGAIENTVSLSPSAPQYLQQSMADVDESRVEAKRLLTYPQADRKSWEKATSRR